MLAENKKIVPIAGPIDLNAAATIDCDSINMKNYHKATLIFLLGTLGGATAVLTINSGATDGACTSALSFNYAYGGAAQGSANCDKLDAWINAASLSITHTTKSNFMLVVEIDAADMDLANEEFWLTARFTDPGGATGLVNAIAILEPRFTGNRSLTAIA